MKESTRAGPAPYRTTTPDGSTSPAAAVPIDEKMPAPITAPIASMIRSPAPMTRFSPEWSMSAMSAAIGLRWKSCDILRPGLYPTDHRAPAAARIAGRAMRRSGRPGEPERRVVGAHGEPALWVEGEPDKTGSGEHEFRLPRPQPIQPARSRERFHDEQGAGRIECETLRP